MMNDLITAIEALNKIKPNNRVDTKPSDFNILDHYPIRGLRPFSQSVEDKRRGVNSEFRVYRREVKRLTELVSHLIPDIDLRGFKNHHIDHKVSIWYGFHNNIPPEQIADLSNLRMLPYKDNMIKGIKCV